VGGAAEDRRRPRSCIYALVVSRGLRRLPSHRPAEPHPIYCSSSPGDACRRRAILTLLPIAICRYFEIDEKELTRAMKKVKSMQELIRQVDDQNSH
jgi:hypothetical protein